MRKEKDLREALKRCKWAVFDLDSTLIQMETIDELARRAGKYDQVAAITKEAMEGNAPFSEMLLKRLRVLKGLDRSVWHDLLDDNVPFTDHAKELFSILKKFGIKTAIVSGGFTEMVEHVAAILGADRYMANQLEYDRDSKITGNVIGPIVDGEAKREFLLTCSSLDTLAVGDGANDIPMLKEATVGIAFMGKQIVKEYADLCIEEPSFKGLVDLLLESRL